MSKKKRYSSHLIVLDAIFKSVSIKNVFEYGCGLYSTKFFVDNAISVESVEMQSQEWYEKIKNEMANTSKNLSLKCMLGADDAIKYFDQLNKKYDLVFVDGWGGQGRVKCVEHAFNKTPIIVVHDVYCKKPNKYIKNMKVDSKYKYIEIEVRKPHTGIYTTNINLINKIKEIFKDKVGE